MQHLRTWLPVWLQDWLDVIVPALQVAAIVLLAWLLQAFVRRLLARLGERYQLPATVITPARRLLRWLIYSVALLLALERLGVSSEVLWTGITGFVTVAAVAFFAAWSVLSNLFCAFLIFTVGPFRVGDHIELLDTAEKPGALGRVVDINLLYTTLEDATAPEPGSLLQIPNALIFQRVLRRWPAGVPVPQGKLHPVPPSGGAATTESAAAPKGASFP